MADPIIPDDSISGNKVHGGVISEFQSTGIQDLATQTSLVVTNGTATVDRIRTKTIDGNVIFPLQLEHSNTQVPILHISSGCVYIGHQKDFTEEDVPNFDFNNGSFYSGSNCSKR